MCSHGFLIWVLVAKKLFGRTNDLILDRSYVIELLALAIALGE
jgi:hypothetical protein